MLINGMHMGEYFHKRDSAKAVMFVAFVAAVMAVIVLLSFLAGTIMDFDAFGSSAVHMFWISSAGALTVIGSSILTA